MNLNWFWLRLFLVKFFLLVPPLHNKHDTAPQKHSNNNVWTLYIACLCISHALQSMVDFCRICKNVCLNIYFTTINCIKLKYNKHMIFVAHIIHQQLTRDMICLIIIEWQLERMPHDTQCYMTSHEDHSK